MFVVSNHTESTKGEQLEKLTRCVSWLAGFNSYQLTNRCYGYCLLS